MYVFFRPPAVILLALLSGTAIVAANNGDPAAAFAEAHQHADNGRPREALKIYESLAEAHPHNATYLTELGRTRLTLRQSLAATWPLQDAVAANPQHEEAYRLLLQAYFESGQSERAYDILQEARKRFGERQWMEDL